MMLIHFIVVRQPPIEVGSEKISGVSSQPLPSAVDAPRETGSEKKRKQLTDTLEELERERYT